MIMIKKKKIETWYPYIARKLKFHFNFKICFELNKYRGKIVQFFLKNFIINRSFSDGNKIIKMKQFHRV